MNSDDALNDTLNIGSNVEISILELAQKIIALTGSTSHIVHLPPLTEGDMTRRLPDVSKMLTYLQRELTPLDTGIKKLIDFYTKAK